MSVSEDQPKEHSGKIIEREQIPDSPFTLITIDEGSFIAMSKYRITDYYKTKEEALEQVNVANWDFLVTTMITVMRLEKVIN